MLARDDLLVWLDLEMTGLDPETCAIVELALIITDRELNAVADPLNLAIWQPESVLDKMSPYVRKMHTKSGLIERIRASTISVEDAEKKAIEKVTDYCKFQTAPLCGNTIGQDRRFLFKYMPTFENFLHYRSIDVSTVKELGQWWHGVRYNKPSEGKHTALHDIQQSIEELRFLRGSIFR